MGCWDASYSLVHYTKDRAAGQKSDYYTQEVEKLFHDAGRNLNEEERIRTVSKKFNPLLLRRDQHIFSYSNKMLTMEFSDRVSTFPNKG